MTRPSPFIQKSPFLPLTKSYKTNRETFKVIHNNNNFRNKTLLALLSLDLSTNLNKMFPGVNQAVEALLRGQESANRLKTVLEQPRTSSVPTEPLFETVLDSFSVALSLFTNFTSSSSNPQSHHESSQNTATRPVARKSPKK